MFKEGTFRYKAGAAQKSSSVLSYSTGMSVPAAPGSEVMYTKIPKGMPVSKFMGEHMETKNPHLMNLFYPRMYNNLGDFNSPKEVAAWMSWTVEQVFSFGIDQAPSAAKLLLPATSYLIEKKMPMFFIDRNLLEAVMRTDFKEEINWVEMRLPYEHGVLVLPRGSVSHPVDGEVSFIVWSRCQPGESRLEYLSKIPQIGRSFTLKVKNETFAMIAMTSKDAIWYDSCLSTEFRPTVKVRNLFYRESKDHPIPNNPTDSIFDSPLKEGDEDFIENIGAIVFGTLLAMQAKPSLLTRGERVGKPKCSGNSTREWWTPNVIGKGYKSPGKPGDGTHASPKMHWRRGHFRQQVYGAGRLLRKQLWIEPILVGAELDVSKEYGAL